MPSGGEREQTRSTKVPQKERAENAGAAEADVKRWAGRRGWTVKLARLGRLCRGGASDYKKKKGVRALLLGTSE